MLKYSKTCEGADDLQQALTSILGILKAVNDSMHLIAITGYEVSCGQHANGGQRYADNWVYFKNASLMRLDRRVRN